MSDTHQATRLLRNLGAIFYDCLLLAAVLFFALIPLVAVEKLFAGHLVWLYNLLGSLYLLGIAFLYFAWQWRRGGQTVGMRAWRIRLVTNDGGAPGIRQCALREITAVASWLCLGLGFLWMLWDREGKSWHDRASHTRLVPAPRP